MTNLVSVIPRGFAGLSFDAVFMEDHSAELEVTENPVETGVLVADHAFMKPYTVRMTVGVTNTPLRHMAHDPYDNSGESRIKAAYNLLLELQKKAEPFDVVTGLHLYRNMLVTTINGRQEGANNNAIKFEVTLREIHIVSTRLVTYPPREAGKTQQQASPKTQGGEKQASKPKKQKHKTIEKTCQGTKSA
jgi:hypothetical protein